jgi:hypothetical protein
VTRTASLANERNARSADKGIDFVRVAGADMVSLIPSKSFALGDRRVNKWLIFPAGVFSGEDNSIPALMRRGVVFMCCHNDIWEQAAALIKADVNPDKLTHGALAAELTNHLVDDAVLIPGAGGTMLELQQAGFHYA